MVAVVAAFWPERFDNVRRIVADLLCGTLVPDRVIVLNNNPEHPGELDYLTDHHGTDKVAVIRSNWNTECRGKFIVGLLDAAPYYLLMDDDTSVGPRTLECFMGHARPGCVFGYWGVVLSPEGSFAQGAMVFPDHVGEETRVDAFHGRGIFTSFSSLVAMLDLESRVRLGTEWATAGDDLIIGLANAASIVPMTGDECFVDLPQGSEAMQFRPGYFAERDAFCTAVLAARDGAPPG